MGHMLTQNNSCNYKTKVINMSLFASYSYCTIHFCELYATSSTLYCQKSTDWLHKAGIQKHSVLNNCVHDKNFAFRKQNAGAKLTAVHVILKVKALFKCVHEPIDNQGVKQ